MILGPVKEAIRMRQAIGLRRLAGESERRLAKSYGRGRQHISQCSEEIMNWGPVVVWDEDMRKACRYAAAYSEESARSFVNEFIHTYKEVDIHKGGLDVFMQKKRAEWGSSEGPGGLPTEFPERTPTPTRRDKPCEPIFVRGVHNTGEASTKDPRPGDYLAQQALVLFVAREQFEGKFLNAYASKLLCYSLRIPGGWIRIEKTGKHIKGRYDFDWRHPQDVYNKPIWTMSTDELLASLAPNLPLDI